MLVLHYAIGKRKDGLKHKILMDGYNGIVDFTRVEEHPMMKDR